MAKTKQQKTNFSQLGRRLKDARETKDISKYAVARNLHLTVSDIADIENGLPEAWQGIYQIGYIKAYAELVEQKLPSFDTEPSLASSEILSPLVKPVSGKSVILSQFASKAAIFVLIFSIVSYVGLQVVVLTSPPRLLVNEPNDGLVTNDTSIKLQGKTDENTDVSINGVSILTEPDGSFSVVVPLKRGVNDIDVTATNRLTKQSKVSRTIITDYEIDPIEF